MRQTDKVVVLNGRPRDARVVWIDDVAEAVNVMKGAKQIYGGGSWYGGETLPEALQYAQRGNEALVPMAEEMMAQIAAEVDTRGFERVASPCGAFPVVGDFLAGRPDCMRRNVPNHHGPVRLIMDTTSSGGIDAEDLQRRGAAFLALVMTLAQERPVELWWTCALDMHGASGCSAVVVRCPTLPLNVSVCAHLLTSQAWTRGVGYSYLFSRGAGGMWPFNTAPGETYAIMREVYDLAPQDVYVPAIYIRDDLIRQPVAWINRQLAIIRSLTND